LLLDITKDGKFNVQDEAAGILRRLNPKSPLRIASVIGVYRAGKSYLMNRLLGRQSGFEMGGTDEGVTHGIWMWVRAYAVLSLSCEWHPHTEPLQVVNDPEAPPPAPGQPPPLLCLLDTEGGVCESRRSPVQCVLTLCVGLYDPRREAGAADVSARLFAVSILISSYLVFNVTYVFCRRYPRLL
jgi:hypothetical protein